VELMPFRMTTTAWRLQYPLAYDPKIPTETDLHAMLKTGGVKVREESGAGPGASTELMAVVAMKKQRGRPSKKALNRHDPVKARIAAAKDKPQLNHIGQLIMVPKKKCSKCGQSGHQRSNCQGRGYIASLVDVGITGIYRERDAAEVALAKVAAASKNVAPDKQIASEDDEEDEESEDGDDTADDIEDEGEEEESLAASVQPQVSPVSLPIT